jgi:hypothetical protein
VSIFILTKKEEKVLIICFNTILVREERKRSKKFPFSDRAKKNSKLRAPQIEKKLKSFKKRGLTAKK